MALAPAEAVETAVVSKPVKPVYLFRADLALRLLLFATTFVPILVVATSTQTVLMAVPFSASLRFDSKFTYSPAFVYYMAVMSVACFYSLITATATALAIYKSIPSTKLLFCFGSLDTVMVGVVASGTGAAASIAYVGLRGNSHVGWSQVCNIFGKFCAHVGVAVGISLVASIILVLLVLISIYTLYRQSRQLLFK